MQKPEKYYIILLKIEKLGRRYHDELDENEIYILKMQ
jgi:hypothetical protein